MSAWSSRLPRLPAWAEPAGLWALGLVLALRYPLHTALSPSEPYLMDFEVYRSVALRLAAGQSELLYAPTTDSAMMVFKYAPFWAGLWTPLAWLSYHTGAVVWTGLAAAALLLTLAWGARLCRLACLPLPPLAVLVPLGLLTRPLAEEMGNGQVNSLWGLLTLGGVYAAAVTRPWLSAMAFAASISLKLPSLLFLAYFLLRRQWGALGRTLACLAGLLGFGAWLLLPHRPGALLYDWLQAMHDWLQVLQHSGTTYAFEIGNQSMLVWLARFLTDDPYGLNLVSLKVSALPWLGLGLLGGALLLAAWPSPQSPEKPVRRWLYDSALLMILMTIFSPSCWVATYLALVWPILLALSALAPRGPQHRPDRLAQVLTAAAVACSLFTHRAAWRLLGLTSWHGEGYLFLVFLVLPWMGLCLFAALWRQRSVYARPAA